MSGAFLCCDRTRVYNIMLVSASESRAVRQSSLFRLSIRSLVLLRSTHTAHFMISTWYSTGRIIGYESHTHERFVTSARVYNLELLIET